MIKIICDLFSFLDKDQIERIQLVNKLWNNVIIRHKNILPLRLFNNLEFIYGQINFYATSKDLFLSNLKGYKIKFDGINFSKIGGNLACYSQLTVDEVLNNLNDVVFKGIQIYGCDSEDYFLNLMELVTKKTGGRFRAKFGSWDEERFLSKLNEIFDKYIIVDELTLGQHFGPGSYIREFCANPEIVQLPSTPKKIILQDLKFQENDNVLHFTCNGKLNRANRLTISLYTSETNYGNFVRQWFEVYSTHQNPISLVGKFKLRCQPSSVLEAVKTFLNNTQLRVTYSLHIYGNQYFKRRWVLHETDSYALMIEMKYREGTEMSSINESDLDQLPSHYIDFFSFCVKKL